MRIESVSKYWLDTFQNINPIGSSFRSLFAKRWIRFHTLHNSKRYPIAEDDYLDALKCYNTILNELDNTNRILLFSVCYSSDKTPVRENKYLDKIGQSFYSLDPKATYWRTIPMHILDGDMDNPNYWHIFVSEWQWNIGVFDAIFRLIAADVISDIFLASPCDSWLYHPYSGGIDVILPSELKRAEMKTKFKRWLPQTDSGL